MKETFGKYLTTRPVSFGDEKFLLEVVDFLTLMIECSKESNLPWIKDLVDIFSNKIGVLSNILTRASGSPTHQFLVSKSNEKVEKLLSSLLVRISSKDREEIENNLFETLVETKPVLNVYLLKLLSEMTLVEHNGSSVEQTTFDLFSKMLKQRLSSLRMKPDLFSESGSHLWTLICLHNLVSPLQHPDFKLQIDVIDV